MTMLNPFKRSLKNIVVAGLSLFMCAGFDFSRHSIPVEEIYDEGPGKDGIPSINNPRFISVDQADGDLLADKDRIIGLVVNGKAKAYPIKILNWHEIVHDRIGDRRVVVILCPLCGTGMVFDAMIEGRPMNFGVSWLLYQNDVLLYDHKTESLWSPIEKQAGTGPMTGTPLSLMASMHTNWGFWKKKHPDVMVLSDRTGYRRDYDRDP